MIFKILKIMILGKPNCITCTSWEKTTAGTFKNESCLYFYKGKPYKVSFSELIEEK